MSKCINVWTLGGGGERMCARRIVTVHLAPENSFHTPHHHPSDPTSHVFVSPNTQDQTTKM